MPETRIQIQQRKIKNGIRKEREAREKKMWDKLSNVKITDYFLEGNVMVTRQTVTGKSRKIKTGWTITDEGYSEVIINEWVTKSV